MMVAPCILITIISLFGLTRLSPKWIAQPALKLRGVILCTTLVSPCLAIEPPVVPSASPAPDLDAMFQQTDGWIGGDGGNSVALSPQKTLWLFSDTWVGKIREGKRTDATIVNNTVGLLDRASGRVTYTIAHGTDGKPGALFVPQDGHGWFWLQAGLEQDGRLSVFLNQVEKTDNDSVFGFRSVDNWLATVNDADKSAESWQIDQAKLSNTEFSKDRTLSWGASVLSVGDDLYVYGTDERRQNNSLDRQMVVARVSRASIGNFAQWKYFRDGQWVDDFRDPTRLADKMGSEFSVISMGSRFILVYTDQGLSPQIMGRVAEHPWGPWSAPAVLYVCPEMSRDKKLFCYGAKAHPSLGKDGELVVSYFVNSFDFWQVAREADLYWPRFVRVSLKD